VRSQHIPMTIEEFHLLPMRPGWKYEYYGGQAHIRPGHSVAVVSLDLKPRNINALYQIRPVTVTDETHLIAAFVEVFNDTVEYCDWEREAIAAEAARSIRGFFAGKRGKPHSSSRVAVSKEGGSDDLRVIGAALIIGSGVGPFLDMLFVKLYWQRAGLATAMVSAAINELYRSGEQKLTSIYHLCNEASRNWHKGFGFVEEPDLSLARMYWRCARHELCRRDKLGELNEQERASLEAECERWKARVEALEQIADREGFEAVTPILRLHRS
jgi:hypothetical protein